MISMWMQVKKPDQYSEGLQFIKLTKNRAYHCRTKRTSYKAVFDCKVIVGVITSSLPQDFLQDVQSKVDLKKIIDSQPLRAETMVCLCFTEETAGAHTVVEVVTLFVSM